MDHDRFEKILAATSLSSPATPWVLWRWHELAGASAVSMMTEDQAGASRDPKRVHGRLDGRPRDSTPRGLRGWILVFPRCRLSGGSPLCDHRFLA